MDAKAKRRLAKATREDLCVGCMQPLDDTRVVCGCHERCYRATYRAIQQGLTTVEERVAAGKLTISPKGPKYRNPVAIELNGK